MLCRLPAVLELSDMTDDGYIPVVISGLRRMLAKGKADGQDSADQFLYITSSFARQRQKGGGKPTRTIFECFKHQGVFNW